MLSGNQRADRLQMVASVSFQNATRGAVDSDLVGDRAWALQADGALNRTGDGTIWVSSRVAAPSPLAAIGFADPEHGWIAGGDGTLLATEDGGATWFRQSREVPARRADAAANAAAMAREQGRFGPYSIWPAPWYGLSLLLVALLLAPALKTPPPYVDPSPSVASLLISDRPIERGEADVFDFNAVALGLSRFLRNEKTEPPLTIAVTGEWGSGKSSLMNLLRGDLRRYGFRPVWFNAWHHQKEDNLLASLLEAVRAQAIPAVWRPEGMTYRLRLLGIRWLRYWPVVALLLLAFSVSAGYLRSDPRRVDQAQGLVDSWGDRIGRVSEVLAGHSAAAPAKPSPASPSAAAPSSASPSAPSSGIQPAPAPPPAGQHVPVAGLLLSGLGLAVSIWKGAKGFGVDPASLLAHDSGRIRDLQALTGFRQRFAAEFGDVTRALNPRTMLILIDDLDRCRPENVIEVLEAVNFLVSSGDCFVVLGMARERVVRCVGLSFKDVADELLDSPAPAAAPQAPTAESPAPESPATTAADLARRRRLEFGQQYLEKLINIEVPVPVPTDAQSRRLLAAGEPAEETPEARRRRRRREVWTWARRLLPVAGFAALLAAGFYYGLTRPPEPRPPVAAPPAPQAGAPRILPGAPAGVPAPASRQLPEPSLGEPPHWTRWPLALLALLLVGLGAWRLSIPPDVVIRDSQEFELALATWHPLLFAWRNTPRSIKRYLNRVRYLAMLQRAPVAEPALSRRLIDSLAGRWQRWRQRPAPAAAFPGAAGAVIARYRAALHPRGPPRRPERHRMLPPGDAARQGHADSRRAPLGEVRSGAPSIDRDVVRRCGVERRARIVPLPLSRDGERHPHELSQETGATCSTILPRVCPASLAAWASPASSRRKTRSSVGRRRWTRIISASSSRSRPLGRVFTQRARRASGERRPAKAVRRRAAKIRGPMSVVT